MIDRELLELAAKAAGYPLIEATRRLTKDKYFEIIYNAAGNRAAWNPLTDDGDALRLAVKLELCMDFRLKASWVCNQDNPDSSLGEWMGISEWHHTDPYAATRRAIVRAAAEIGKGMK